MKNFEKIVEKKEEKIDIDVFEKLNHEVESYIASKVNKFVVILESLNFDFNQAKPRLEKKIDSLINELKSKFFSHIYIEGIEDILERKILKISFEDLAERKLDGTLSFNENLENKYLQILFDEAKFYLENDQNLENNHYSIDYVKGLLKFLNKKNILNKSLQGDLINKILADIEYK
jgi:hypothetical protein